MNKVIITNVTDPVCPWCWGEEPFFRKLETHFPNLITWRNVMGGLVEDMNKNKPADIDTHSYYNKENKDFITHCLETAEKHHMPIKVEGFNLFSETENSSFPLCIAFKAAQMADAEKADLFLYNLRAAAMARPKKLSGKTLKRPKVSRWRYSPPSFSSTKAKRCPSKISATTTPWLP